MKLYGGRRAAKRSPRKSPQQERKIFCSAVKTAGKPNKEKKGCFAAGAWIKRHRNLFILPCCVAVAFLIVSVIYAVWEEPPVQNVERPGSLESSSAAATPAPEETPAQENPDESDNAEINESSLAQSQPTPAPLRSENCYTFLIAVIDELGVNTDAMMVGRLDLDTGRLDVASLPRDTLVNVSWGVKKLNTVYLNVNSDPEKLVNHLAGILGFRVDCYAVMEMDMIEEIVDCIGGVSYNVRRNMDYEDPTQNLSIHIPAGLQWLSGEDVVKVLRYREGSNGTGYANGDLGRIDTQHDFLLTLADQLLSLGNIPNLENIIRIFEENVVTNLSAANMAFFAREFLLLDKENIFFHTLPGSGISIRGGSYYEIDADQWLETVNACLNPFYADIEKADVDILDYVDSTIGAVSTTGDTVSNGYFYNFADYTG